MHIAAAADNGRMDAADLVFKALADPTRRTLIDRLHARSGQTLTALCRQLDMSRQAVSQHLAVLEAANLVAVVRQGRERLHYFNPVPIHEVASRWIRAVEVPRLDALHALKTRLEGEAHEPDHHSERDQRTGDRRQERRAVRVRDLYRDHG